MADEKQPAATALPERTEGAPEPDREEASQPLVEADLLIEDVSIDGMCGVY
jgi:mycofactocin precursor